jgi:hypothetical protein
MTDKDTPMHKGTAPGPAETVPDSEQAEREQAARVAAARTLLDEDRRQRQTDCLAAIEAACDRYGMVLHIEPARLTLTPRD